MTMILIIALVVALVLLLRWKRTWLFMRICPNEILLLENENERYRIYFDTYINYLKRWRTWITIILYCIPLIFISTLFSEITLYVARTNNLNKTELLFWLFMSKGVMLFIIPLQHIHYKKWSQKYLRMYLNNHGVYICMNCGYDLRGMTEQRCPECGTEFEKSD